MTDDVIVPRAMKNLQTKRYIRYGGSKTIRAAGLFPKAPPTTKTRKPVDQKPHEPIIEVMHAISETEWKPFIHPEVAQRYHDTVVAEFPDVFGDKLPPRKTPKPGAPKHRIILKDNRKTINGRMFAIPEKFAIHMMDFISENLAAGRIRPSSSSVASGTWMIPKKDSTARPRVVHDDRALNDNTVKDHTPLPRQDQIICRMARAKIRGILDCLNSYYQMDMHPDSVHLTAFKTPFGMFEWLVMPQGLCNACATWQRFMNWVLRKYVGRICYVYIDDIGIFSNSVEEHHRNVRLVLEALREAGDLRQLHRLSSVSQCLLQEQGLLCHYEPH